MQKEEEIIEPLRKIKKILDNHKINYWLDEGALLGAVREKKLIAWDHDIDLSIWNTDIEKIKPLFDEFRDSGNEVCYFEGKKHLKLVGAEYEIDINLYNLKDDQATRMWYSHNKLGKILDYIIWILHIKNADLKKSKMPLFVTKALVKLSNTIPESMNKKIVNILYKIYDDIGCKHIKMAVPSKFFTDLSSLEFYGMNFKVPKKTEEYLEYRYGKDWKIPKKDYVYTADDQSIVKK